MATESKSSKITIVVLFAIFFALVLIEFVNAIDKDPGYHAGPGTDQSAFVDRP